jgi:hypothetical protein
MIDEINEDGRPEVTRASPKRTWTEPKIESVPGREAQASFLSYGGMDAGIYS